VCFLRLSCDNPLITVKRKNPSMIYARVHTIFIRLSIPFIPKNHPKMLISRVMKNNNKELMNDHGHDLARMCRTLTGRCVRHQVNGLFILVATTPAMIARSMGAMPPPNKSSTIDSKIKIRLPYFR